MTSWVIRKETTIFGGVTSTKLWAVLLDDRLICYDNAYGMKSPNKIYFSFLCRHVRRITEIVDLHLRSIFTFEYIDEDDVKGKGENSIKR